MLQTVEKYERFVYGALIVILMVVIAFALGELVWSIIEGLVSLPGSDAASHLKLVSLLGVLDDNELIGILGIFLLILIGVELLDTMVGYLRENTIHVEIVVVLAIIAIARKVILLNPGKTDGFELIGIGVIIIGLAGAYYLLKKSGYTIGKKEPVTKENP